MTIESVVASTLAVIQRRQCSVEVAIDATFQRGKAALTSKAKDELMWLGLRGLVLAALAESRSTSGQAPTPAQPAVVVADGAYEVEAEAAVVTSGGPVEYSFLDKTYAVGPNGQQLPVRIWGRREVEILITTADSKIAGWSRVRDFGVQLRDDLAREDVSRVEELSEATLAQLATAWPHQ